MTTGLDVFDTTVQESNVWLKNLMQQLGTDDRHLAYRMLRATLHALRDRIGPENAVHFGAQLPMLLRGLYYEGWQLHSPKTKERHMSDFLRHVEAAAGRNLGSDTEDGVRAVFDVIWDMVDPGEAEKLVEMFPKSLRELWPQLG